MSQFKSVALIGTGRVAHQLGAALKENDVEIASVFGRFQRDFKRGIDTHDRDAMSSRIGAPFAAWRSN